MEKKISHLELEEIVVAHCKMYDEIFHNIEYDHNKHHGEIDVYAVRQDQNGIHITIYEVKSHYGKHNLIKARHQLYKAREYLCDLYHIDDCNMVYVSSELVWRMQ